MQAAFVRGARLKSKLSAFLALAVLGTSVPLLAHHGAAMYDMEREITVKGIVTNFEWSNPHVLIYADVRDEKGNAQKWIIETRGGPNALARAGWNKDTLKAGDQVTLIGHPARDGSNNMRLAKIVLPNGQELDPNPRSFF
jgi:Family of unknown function (DUF6152)